MRPFRRTAISLALLPFFAPVSWGLGLGEITMLSYLNEPLRAEVVLLDVQDLRTDDIKIRMATQDDFDRLGIDRAYFLTSIRFDVVIKGDESKIILSTQQPLREPYLDFLLETRWPSGRLLRGYTVLVDLPKQIASAVTAKPALTALAQDSAESAQESVAAYEPIAAPRERIQREYDKDTEDSPRAGGQYLVKTNDTLSEIVASARPKGASIEQTMIATVAMNGDAFIGSNINGLKAGYVLELPSEREILLSAQEAFAEVAQQNADWTAGIRRTRPVRVVADDPFEAPNESSHDAVAGADDGGNVSSGLAELTSERGINSVSEIPAKADTAAPVAGLEQVAGVNTNGSLPDLTAINARLSALSEQMTELRQVVVLKDQQIAMLQAELAAQKAAATAATDTSAASTPAWQTPWWVYVLAGVVAFSAVGVLITRRASARSTVGSSRDEIDLLASETLAVDREPLVAGARDRRSGPKQLQAEPEKGAAMSGKRAYDTPLYVADTRADTHADRQAGTYTDSRAESLANTPDYADDSTVADALAEADIYMAYGRDQQALDLLEMAAKIDPDNAAPYLKIIEIHLKNDRRAEAEAVMLAIERTHNAEAVERALELLDSSASATSGYDLSTEAGLAEIGVPATAFTEATGAATHQMTGALSADLSAMDFELVNEGPDKPLTSIENNVSAKEASEPLDLELDLSALSLEAGLGVEDRSSSATDTANPLTSRPRQDAGDEPATRHAQDRLPPELAAVLGSDIPPPFDELGDEEESGLIYSVETDPIDTQLDLARAYIDMGDDDGARPVLEDVISKGSLQQQAEARELLSRID